METGKLTAQVLQVALKKFWEAQKHSPKLHQGQQSLTQLKQHGAALSSIEVTDANIAAFNPCAKKYGAEFALREAKPSIRKALSVLREAAGRNVQRAKEKIRERGMEL